MSQTEQHHNHNRFSGSIVPPEELRLTLNYSVLFFFTMLHAEYTLDRITPHTEVRHYLSYSLGSVPYVTVEAAESR